MAGAGMMRRRAAAAGALLAAFAVAACDRPDRLAELRAAADTLLPRLERLTGLRQRGEVRIELRDRAAVREYVARRVDEEMPAEDLEALTAAYAEFGLMPASLDLRGLLIDLAAEQVLGYYDPATKALYLVQDAPIKDATEVLAHELVHALQDQYIDLDSLISRVRVTPAGTVAANDRQLAAHAAIEGQATLAMLALAAEGQLGGPIDPAALPDLRDELRRALEAENDEFPVFRDAPRIIRETLLFPYLGGAGFVQVVARARGRVPLDSLIPESSEQVMHPRLRFVRGRDHPTEVRFEDDGPWRVAYENTLGELETSVLLGEHLGPGGVVFAAGWDGDRFRLLRGPEGKTAIIWAIVWDDREAAQAFSDAWQSVIRRRRPRSGSIRRITIDERPVVIVVDAAPGVVADSVPVPAVRLVGG